LFKDWLDSPPTIRTKGGQILLHIFESCYVEKEKEAVKVSEKFRR